MGLAFTAFTLSGPIPALIGFFLAISLLFWIGTGLAGLNLFMNLASGAMKFPLFPIIVIAVGSLFWSPWYQGGAIGLLAYTAIEGLGEFLPRRFWPVR